MNKKLIEQLKAGLREAILHQQGKIKLRTVIVEVVPKHQTKKDKNVNHE